MDEIGTSMPMQKVLSACCLALLLLILGWTEDPSLAIAEERLHAISVSMESLRFCKRATCRYRDIQVTIEPLADPDVPYLGSIQATIVRPSEVEDQARYRLEFRDNHWHLLSGEELSDVSSFFFEGDEYELYSSYSGRTRREKLAEASRGLRVGYRDIYYRILDNGIERDPIPTD